MNFKFLICKETQIDDVSLQRISLSQNTYNMYSRHLNSTHLGEEENRIMTREKEHAFKRKLPVWNIEDPKGQCVAKAVELEP